MKALVVDDSRAMRAILRRALQDIDFEVVEAVDGVEALRVLEGTGPLDLARVDWHMPEMNGLDFVRSVRANARYDDMKIIIVSTESERDRVEEALAAGTDEYIMKPFDSTAIAAKLGMLGLS